MKHGTTLIVLALTSALLVLPLVVDGAGNASPQPANKMAVVGSAVSVSGPGEVKTILTGIMKASSPTDAIITVSLECDILTSVTTVGDDDQRAFGQVLVWVTIGGKPVPVASDDTGAGVGRVVFCDRAHQQTTKAFDINGDEDENITTMLQTRSSNSFQWVALDLGSAVHTFEVKALLTETTTNAATAKAVIGKRVLTVDPTKLATNAAI